eukprot:Platyproteum_vivax@DN5308_c0_g1_i1.p2
MPRDKDSKSSASIWGPLVAIGAVVVAAVAGAVVTSHVKEQEHEEILQEHQTNERLQKKRNERVVEENRHLHQQLNDLPGPNITIGDDEPKKGCIVCMRNVVDCALQPCGHAQTCLDCGSVVEECPICRVPIMGRVKIFL